MRSKAEAVTEFATEHGISRQGVAVFAGCIRLLSALPDHERMDVIAFIAKCHVETPLRAAVFLNAAPLTDLEAGFLSQWWSR